MKHNLSKSKEDYLEAVLINIQTKGACRMTDIANYLGYSRASVSVALKKLEDEQYIYRDDWRILLTEQGMKIAEEMLIKHTLFKNWFLALGVEEKVADEEACQIEHALSDETFIKISKYFCEKDPDLLVQAYKS